MPGQDEMNGHAAIAESDLANRDPGAESAHEESAVASPAADQQREGADKARAVIDAQVRNIMGITVRGILVSSPTIPPEELVKSMARVAGSILATALTSDFQTILRLRGELKQQFKDGVNKTPMANVVAAAAEQAKPARG